MSVNIKIMVFYDMMPHSLNDSYSYKRFGGICCIYPEEGSIRFLLKIDKYLPDYMSPRHVMETCEQV
jgi:hypothetical protein